jgi:hypothetical protein
MGCNGSCNSGIESGGFPLAKAELVGASFIGSGDVPFAFSLLDR